MASPRTLARLQARHDDASGVTEPGADAVTVLDFKTNSGRVEIGSGFVAHMQATSVGPAILAPFLPSLDACLLHASAIIRDGRAAVFLAPDEGGKTTAVRLASSGTILCDDQVIVRRRRKRFHVWGTPWGLHVNATAHAPLAGLFLLKKAKRFSLTHLPAHRLVPFIWQEIKAQLSILPKPLKTKAFRILCDITASAPAWTLAFPKNHIDWQQVDSALQGRIEDAGRKKGKQRKRRREDEVGKR